MEFRWRFQQTYFSLEYSDIIKQIFSSDVSKNEDSVVPKEDLCGLRSMIRLGCLGMLMSSFCFVQLAIAEQLS